MPLLGYFGYLPFSMELFALSQLTISLLKPGRFHDYIRISKDSGGNEVMELRSEAVRETSQ